MQLNRQRFLAVAARGITATLAATGATTPAWADQGVLAQPGNQVATPDGALSLLGNPAGMNGISGYDLRLQLGGGGGTQLLQSDGARQDGLAFGLAAALPLGPLALGAALESTSMTGPTVGARRDLTQTHLAMSFASSERLRLGVEWLGRSDNGDGLRHGWRVGAQWLPSRYLALGLRAGIDPRNAFDSRTNSVVALGAAVRPLGTDRWTLSAEVQPELSDGLARNSASLSTTVTVARGIQLVAQEAAQEYSISGIQAYEWRTSALLRVSFGSFGTDVGGQIESHGRGGRVPDAVVGLRLSGDHLPSQVDRGDPVVMVDLKGELGERQGESGTHFGTLLLSLRHLTGQTGTEVVVLRARALKLDWAQVEELRSAIKSLRKSGKIVVWYADELGTRSLAVAAASTRIWLTPAGSVMAHGIAADFVPLAETLNKLGVTVQVARYSDFKSAGEQLERRELSPELRQTLQHAVERRWHDFAEAVALGRDVTPGQVEEILTRGVVYPADAKGARIIDAVVAPGQLDAQLIREGWLEPNETAAYLPNTPLRKSLWGPAPSIAVVQLEGSIVDHDSARGLTGSAIGGTQTAELLGKLGQDPDTAGVVARIMSGGGSASGSEAMREALAEVAESKPVIASMGGMAASGGFWLALGAPLMLADRSTVTGSIGILMVKPEFSGLYGKLGTTPNVLSRGPWSEIERTDRPWTPQEFTFVHKQLGRFYDLFIDRVADRRGLKREQVLPLAGGRLWFGDEAVEHKLVDRTGGLLDALAEVERQVGQGALAVRFVPELSWSDKLRRAVGVNAANSHAILGNSPALTALLTRAVGPWLDAAALAVLADAQPQAHSEVAIEPRAP